MFEEKNQKIPKCLFDIIGRTCKFQLKLTTYTFQARRLTFTASSIVEDNIDTTSKGKEGAFENDEIDNSVPVNSGKLKKKIQSVEMEESSKKKEDKRQRLNNWRNDDLPSQTEKPSSSPLSFTYEYLNYEFLLSLKHNGLS